MRYSSVEFRDCDGRQLWTGSATDLDTQRADASGLTLLPKPVPVEELRGAVRQALRTHGRSRPGE